MPQANLLQSAAAQDPPGTRAVGAWASFSLGLPPFPRLLAIGRWILLVLIALSALSRFVLLRTAEDASALPGFTRQERTHPLPLFIGEIGRITLGLLGDLGHPTAAC